MNAIYEFLHKPAVMTVLVLIACLYIMHSTSKDFLSDMQKDRDDMVASLRQAQTPEPQIMAISKGFDRITWNVYTMGTSFFAYTAILLIGAYAENLRKPTHQDSQRPRGELPQGKVA
jgi:hypothetical protein